MKSFGSKHLLFLSLAPYLFLVLIGAACAFSDTPGTDPGIAVYVSPSDNLSEMSSYNRNDLPPAETGVTNESILRDEGIAREVIPGAPEGEGFAKYERCDTPVISVMSAGSTYTMNWTIESNVAMMSTTMFNFDKGDVISTYVQWTPANAAGTSAGLYHHATNTYRFYQLTDNPESGTITVGKAGTYSVVICNTSTYTIHTTGSYYTVSNS